MTQPASAWNIANAITITRILLVPVVVWLLFDANVTGSMTWIWALLLFVLSAATDGVDGAIARRRGLITNLGKILDPIADKALIGVTMIVLSILGELPWWATILVLGRELGITIYRLVVVRRKVLSATGGGKFKTVFQIVVISIIIIPASQILGEWFTLIELGLVSTMVAITLVTGLQILVSQRRG